MNGFQSCRQLTRGDRRKSQTAGLDLYISREVGVSNISQQVWAYYHQLPNSHLIGTRLGSCDFFDTWDNAWGSPAPKLLCSYPARPCLANLSTRDLKNICAIGSDAGSIEDSDPERKSRNDKHLHRSRPSHASQVAELRHGADN